MKNLILGLIGFLFMFAALALFGFVDLLRTLSADLATMLDGILSGDWRAILGLVLAALFELLILLFSTRPGQRGSGDS
jgi:hypothetical protein